MLEWTDPCSFAFQSYGVSRFLINSIWSIRKSSVKITHFVWLNYLFCKTFPSFPFVLFCWYALEVNDAQEKVRHVEGTNASRWQLSTEYCTTGGVLCKYCILVYSLLRVPMVQETGIVVRPWSDQREKQSTHLGLFSHTLELDCSKDPLLEKVHSTHVLVPMVLLWVEVGRLACFSLFQFSCTKFNFHEYYRAINTSPNNASVF